MTFPLRRPMCTCTTGRNGLRLRGSERAAPPALHLRRFAARMAHLAIPRSRPICSPRNLAPSGARPGCAPVQPRANGVARTSCSGLPTVKGRRGARCATLRLRTPAETSWTIPAGGSVEPTQRMTRPTPTGGPCGVVNARKLERIFGGAVPASLASGDPPSRGWVTRHREVG